MAVGVTALNLPGAGGHDYARIEFINLGSVTCFLTGYPGVSLLGPAKSLLTAPASRAPANAADIVLAPGEVASTLLVDTFAGCVASTRSTFVRVYAPNLWRPRDLPLAMTPCSLSVKPLVAGRNPAA
jgi:hypothetical protein